MIQLIIGAIFASLGFGVIFNIRKDKLVGAVIGGVLGTVINELLIIAGVDQIMSLFIASMFFGLYAEYMARKLKTPVTSFILIALIILVPGGGMYNTMMEIIKGDTYNALKIGADTLAKAGALALGTIFASTINKFLLKSKKK